MDSSELISTLRSSGLGDYFWMYQFKVLPCPHDYRHSWTACPFAHQGETAKRRCPKLYSYSPDLCPAIKSRRACPNGDICPLAHNTFEQWLHPQRYRTCLCYLGASCRRPTCFFAHNIEELRSVTSCDIAAHHAASLNASLGAMTGALPPIPLGPNGTFLSPPPSAMSTANMDSDIYASIPQILMNLAPPPIITQLPPVSSIPEALSAPCGTLASPSMTCSLSSSSNSTTTGAHSSMGSNNSSSVGMTQPSLSMYSAATVSANAAMAAAAINAAATAAAAVSSNNNSNGVNAINNKSMMSYNSAISKLGQSMSCPPKMAPFVGNAGCPKTMDFHSRMSVRNDGTPVALPEGHLPSMSSIVTNKSSSNTINGSNSNPYGPAWHSPSLDSVGSVTTATTSNNNANKTNSENNGNADVTSPLPPPSQAPTPLVAGSIAPGFSGPPIGFHDAVSQKQLPFTAADFWSDVDSQSVWINTANSVASPYDARPSPLLCPGPSIGAPLKSMYSFASCPSQPANSPYDTAMNLQSIAMSMSADVPQSVSDNGPDKYGGSGGGGGGRTFFPQNMLAAQNGGWLMSGGNNGSFGHPHSHSHHLGSLANCNNVGYSEGIHMSNSLNMPTICSTGKDRLMKSNSVNVANGNSNSNNCMNNKFHNTNNSNNTSIMGGAETNNLPSSLVPLMVANNSALMAPNSTVMANHQTMSSFGSISNSLNNGLMAQHPNGSVGGGGGGNVGFQVGSNGNNNNFNGNSNSGSNVGNNNAHGLSNGSLVNLGGQHGDDKAYTISSLIEAVRCLSTGGGGGGGGASNNSHNHSDLINNGVLGGCSFTHSTTANAPTAVNMTSKSNINKNNSNCGFNTDTDVVNPNIHSNSASNVNVNGGKISSSVIDGPMNNNSCNLQSHSHQQQQHYSGINKSSSRRFSCAGTSEGSSSLDLMLTSIESNSTVVRQSHSGMKGTSNSVSYNGSIDRESSNKPSQERYYGGDNISNFDQNNSMSSVYNISNLQDRGDKNPIILNNSNSQVIDLLNSHNSSSFISNNSSNSHSGDNQSTKGNNHKGDKNNILLPLLQQVLQDAISAGRVRVVNGQIIISGAQTAPLPS